MNQPFHPSPDTFLPGAIYLRLSKDDEANGESMSIANQRKLLLKYARDHHFSIEKEYVDDGYSGTSFCRPAFSRMISDIEQGEIRLVLTKDLSRLGRDYIKTGEYTELFFPSHGVRFIAVNDGYDSACSSSDLIPFRNVINEMYARDISRKIRASLAVRMEEGSFIGSRPPYGYIAVQTGEDGQRKRSLLPDPEAARVVRFLFSEAACGVKPSELALRLNAQKVPCPSAYRNKNSAKSDGTERLWTANTIIKLLHNPVYLGHLVQGKTRKLSFKSQIFRTVPPQERIRIPHAHPPLVSEEVFLQCEEQLRRRTCRAEKH